MVGKAQTSSMKPSKRKFEEASSGSDDDSYGSGGPDEQSNGESSIEGDSETDGSDIESSAGAVKQNSDVSDVPLYKRLAERSTEEAVTAHARENVKKRRIKDAAKGWYLEGLFLTLLKVIWLFRGEE
jgi:hypothetical protein